MTTTNALTLVSNGQDEDLQELQITPEGLSEFIANFLKEEGFNFSVADILEKANFADFRSLCENTYDLHVQEVNEERAKKRRVLETAKQQAEVATAKELSAKLRERYGLPPVLTQDQIRASAKAANAKVTAKPVIVKQPTGEERRANLRKQFGLMLPDLVFQSAERAVAFRQVLKKCIQPLRDKLKEQDLEAQYKDAIGQLYNSIQKRLFPMADMVITDGWNLDLKTPVRSNNLFDEVVEAVAKDKRFAEMMRWMGKCPTPEELKAHAEAKVGQQTEVQVLDEAETARRNQLKDSLKARLAEVEDLNNGPAQTPEQKAAREQKHQLQATSLIKHYGHLPDIKVIFMARAVFQMTPKDGKQPDGTTARFYAKCAGVPFEVVLGVVAANAQPEQKPSGSKAESEPSSTVKPQDDKAKRRQARLDARAARNSATSRGGRGKGKKKQ